jgi:sigma-B regulation protein RsbU (phosphoserine phosphatase)
MAEPKSLSQDLIGAVNIGLIAIDNDLRVAAWNPWMQSATGLAEAAVLGRPLKEVFPHRNLARLERAVLDAQEQGVSRLLSHRLHVGLLALTTRTGAVMTHDIAVSPLGERPFTYSLVQVFDITVAVEREQVLRDRQNARYAAVVDNAPDAILTVDRAGLVQQINSAGALQFGRPAAELVGQPIRELFEEKTNWDAVWQSALAGAAQHRAVTLTARRQDGSTTLLEATAARWLNQAQLFVSVILRDSNERHAAEEALRKLNEAVAQSLMDERQVAELREQFIAVLGHDLRNPLASIDSGIRILQRDAANEKARSIGTMMQRSVMRMASLIDNVLDFARGRLGGGLSLDRRKQTLEPILEQVIDELRASWPDREIDARISFTAPIDSDAVRLSQLLSNLAGNALTHGAATGPVVVSAVDANGWFELTVSNPGPEIPPAALERLFQPFARGEVSPNKQGLGLGLFISSEIAKAHGGVLTAESGNGMIHFVFRMPLA